MQARQPALPGHSQPPATLDIYARTFNKKAASDAPQQRLKI